MVGLTLVAEVQSEHCGVVTGQGPKQVPAVLPLRLVLLGRSIGMYCVQATFVLGPLVYPPNGSCS